MSRLFLFTFILLQLLALGENPLDRLKDKTLRPFNYGVASGDPLHDRVILWTKVEADSSLNSIEVYWEIARDTTFTDIMNSGKLISFRENDFTVKVDADLLESNTWYYYRFRYNDKFSIIGRTKTLPLEGEANTVRLAVASCQDYQSGYFNAYKSLVRQNKVDAIVFLGDYIYEYASHKTQKPTTDFRKRKVRANFPENEIVELEDYRNRYKQYRLDPDLRAAHQQFPWICVWDDHEHANNAWRKGAQNHQPELEGDWEKRLINSIKAYHEWLPVRLQEESNPMKIYRNFEFGKLFNLIMLDTRIIGRDEPLNNRLSVTDSILNIEDRYLLGEKQLNWLDKTMANNKSEWTIIGQQIMMSPLFIKIPFTRKTKIGNDDQWDGYPQERKRLYSMIEKYEIENFVVLSGDIHTAIASNLPKFWFSRGILADNYGVEFITPSISSRNLEKPMLLFRMLTRSVNPNIKFLDLRAHGYYMLDINRERIQADYIFVDNVKSKKYKERKARSLKVNNGNMRLKRVRKQVKVEKKYPALAPRKFNF